MCKFFTPEEEREIVRLYLQGRSIFEISLDFDCSTTPVYKVLKKYGVIRQGTKWGEKEWFEMLRIFRLAVILLVRKNAVDEVKALFQNHINSSSTRWEYLNLLFSPNFLDVLRKRNRKWRKNLAYIKKFIEPLERERIRWLSE